MTVAEKSARRFAKETPLGKKRRARKINRILAEVYPNAQVELDFATPFQLLIATVLSAQTTDIRVNSVTPGLFAAFPDAHALAVANLGEVEELIRSTGFYRAKARNIVKLANDLVDDYDGEVPRTMEELVKLAGVGRKTANVVLGNAFDTPGITVDTHMG
ncbi:endonuclease III, partial [Geobacillus sp. MMMUD3]|nr:endonuclease III [Geobacillus sp. MMMUD3]